MGRLRKLDERLSRPIPGTPDLNRFPELLEVLLFAGALISFAIFYVVAGDELSYRVGLGVFLVLVVGSVSLWIRRRRAKAGAMAQSISDDTK